MRYAAVAMKLAYAIAFSFLLVVVIDQVYPNPTRDSYLFRFALGAGLVVAASVPLILWRKRQGWLFVLPATFLLGGAIWSLSQIYVVRGLAGQLSLGGPSCLAVFEVLHGVRWPDGVYRRANAYDLTALQLRLDPVSTGMGSYSAGPVAVLLAGSVRDRRVWAMDQNSDARRAPPSFQPALPSSFLSPLIVRGCGKSFDGAYAWSAEGRPIRTSSSARINQQATSTGAS